MAAKQGKTGVLGLVAFAAICLNALAWLLSCIFEWANISINIGNASLQSLLTAIANLMLLFVTIFVAHDFASKQSKTWRIIFWVLAISSLLAVFIGVGVNFA